ncbi:MAG: major capsid protein [Marinomonas sp.]
MATIGNNVLTLTDWAKRNDPKGKTPMIVEILSQTNAALEDMPFKEGNLPTGEQVTIRTGLPTSYYRMTNQGVPKSKSTTAQVTENAAMLEARSEVDVKVAKNNGNVSTFRLSESKAFIESMSQRQAQTLVYGSNANPEEYVGLASRYNDLSATNADNILSAGGAGADNTSIFLVGWGSDTVYGVYPKGSKAGLEHQDLGEIDAFDGNNNRFRAYADMYTWDNGLVVKDWRYVVRIPNIDVSDLRAQTGTQAETAATAIIKLMAQAQDRIPNINAVKDCFYVNRTVASFLRMAALEKSSSAVTIEPAINQFGKTIHQLTFLGTPVKLMDSILNNEAAVS